MYNSLKKIVTNVFVKNKKSKKELSIYIWGCNDFSKSLYYLLEQCSRIKIVAFIDNSKTANNLFCGVPVYSPKEFKQQGQINFPIIVAVHHNFDEGPRVDFESVYQFKLRLQEITYEHGIENHLLHPAALIDFISVDYPNKIIPFGLPGSGITLLGNICSKIMESSPSYFRTKN